MNIIKLRGAAESYTNWHIIFDENSEVSFSDNSAVYGGAVNSRIYLGIS